jgi:hypothetical protein
MAGMRRRLWIEMGLASASAALALATLVRRDWVEALTGADPDRHGGALEWALVAALLLVSFAAALGAHAELRRPAAPR